MLTGWTRDQIAEAPALYLDHLLACDRAAAEARQKIHEREREAAKARQR